jgi:hypothetical protein
MADALTLHLNRSTGRFFYRSADGREIPRVAGGDGPEAATLDVPADDAGLQALDDAALEQLDTSVNTALDELEARATSEPESITTDDAARAAQLAEAASRIAAESARRAAEAQANVDGVLNAVRGARPEGSSTETPPAEPETPAETPAPAPEAPAPAPAPETPAEAPAEHVEAELVAASAASRPLRVPAAPRRGTLNPAMSLRQIARAQDPNRRPTPANAAARAAAELVITAAADIPGVPSAVAFDDFAALGRAFSARANAMAPTAGNGSPMPVATIARNFPEVLPEQHTESDVDEALARLLEGNTSRRGMEALVAAGGWCAPSEIDYSFFDVASVGNTVDLPTIGIRRGGLRWPISLTLAGFFALSGAPPAGVMSNATMPWQWTEADDLATVTGTGAKACLRPPCPSFDEARLIAYGICVLAGNLTEDAYPELVRHFVGLTMIAHQRALNRRHIAQMVAHSTATAVSPTVGAASSAVTHVLGAVELEATSYRLKYGAPDDAVLELLLPVWARGLMRSDLRKRNGFNDLAAADSFLMSLFDAINVRVQWVEDWQHLPGSSGAGQMGATQMPTAWPTSFLGLMYFPGHYFRGNGMTLNLGVVRDSVLNAENDHTAAWSEEATLIGARGPESLLITFGTIYPNGVTGMQVAQSAASA